MVVVEFLLIAIFVLMLASIRIVNQYETGVVLRLGRLSRVAQPGLNLVLPLIESMRKVDMRIQTLDIPAQQVITKDNVPIMVNGVIYFKVDDAIKATLNIQDFQFAVSQFAETALKDVVGGMTLDEVLAERERIGLEIAKIVDKETSGWGLDVSSIKLQDVDMAPDLKALMSRQASAEREKRANITKSEGDKIAAVNLAAAAKIMSQNPGAMQLRTLQSIDGLGPTPSNTVILFPIEIIELVNGMLGKKK